MKRALQSAVAAALLSLAVPAFAADTRPGEERPRLDLSIETPEPSAVVGDPGGMAFVAGRALAHYGEFETFDIIFVIDQSDSTSNPSGADIDGDGEIGRRPAEGTPVLSLFGQFFRSSDSADNILSAEIAAVETMLEQLDPRTTRVGIVGFAGDMDPLTPDANVVVPLSSDYSRVRRGLEDIRSDGPGGRTNMMAGIQVATVELIGSQSAFSERREGARRIMLFLTDGKPTLPFENSTHNNRRLAIGRAAKAADFQIRIDTFAIGEEALADPVVTVEMARVTDGIFTPVLNPRDLQAVFESVNFSDIEALEIRNLTNDKPASYVNRAADGSYSALIPMNEGDNVVEVYARSSDGTEARRKVPLRFLANGDVQPLTPALLAARNRLMEARLTDLKRRAVEIETSRDEQVRDTILADIEKKREEMLRRVEIETQGESDRENED